MRYVRRSTMVSLLALILVAVPLAGCASTKGTGGSGGAAAAAGECFAANMTNSFSYLHGRYVYVDVIGGKHYLLTLANECLALRSAMNIAISSEFEQVCSDSGAAITYSSFDRMHYCRVIKVQEVKDKAEAELLVKELTTPKAMR